MLDLLIASVPVLDLQYPPSSPAIIKACAIAGGFTARTIDLNIELKTLCGSTDRFLQVQYNFENANSRIVDSTNPVDAFFNNDLELIQSWLDRSVQLIAQHNPQWLGISVFSYKSHKATLALCVELHQKLPHLRIVLGGRGASSFLLGPDHSQFVKKMKSFFGSYPHKNFGETLLSYGLIDTVIQGDGEKAIIDLLSGHSNTNVTGSIKDINMETLPFVDFDDYDLSAYEYVNEPTIPITGSKGCVRKCTFCDIPVLWPRFKFRSGEHIAREMIHLFRRHGVKKFYMSDSLVNGSLDAFSDFVSTLASHNQHNPEHSIKWIGQYITRPRSNRLNSDYYSRLKASGGEGLTIGVESGSDAVRAHMKKHFETADIDHEIQQFDQHGIVCVLLFFSCYPTETWQDFLDTVNMFVRYQKYCASGTVYKITLGIPYTHHAQTPLWNMQQEIGLNSAAGSDVLWLLETNPELTFYERCRRRLILQEVATALHLPMSRNTPELNQLIDSLTLHHEAIERFFGEKTPIETYPDQFELLGTTPILMPPDMQLLIYNHLCFNPDMIPQIMQKHQHIQDDIRFDNENYHQLKQLLIDQQ